MKFRLFWPFSAILELIFGEFLHMLSKFFWQFGYESFQKSRSNSVPISNPILKWRFDIFGWQVESRFWRFDNQFWSEYLISFFNCLKMLFRFQCCCTSDRIIQLCKFIHEYSWDDFLADGFTFSYSRLSFVVFLLFSWFLFAFLLIFTANFEEFQPISHQFCSSTFWHVSPQFWVNFWIFSQPILTSFNQFPANFFLLFLVNFYKPILTSIWTHFDIFRPNVRSIFEYFYGQFRWVSTNFPPFLKVFLVHLLGPISVIIWEYLGVFIPILN